ncbi:MAG: hypothetical protein Q9175_005373 [Cornicularia normoerica]
MPEIHATIDAQPSTEGEDISNQIVALPVDQPDSVPSHTRSCTGLSDPFEEHSFTDDGYVSDVDDYDPGYGKVAAIGDLDGDFLVFRKFGWLHNYALLYLQDELVQLQDEIEAFDRWESRNGDPTKLVSRRKDNAFHESRRKELVGKLHAKLAEYDELLLRMQKIQAIKRPTERSQSNLSNLISNTQSLVSDESDWIRYGPDLAALGRGAEHGWLNTFLEDTLNKISMTLTMASLSFLAHSNCYLYRASQIHPCNHPYSGVFRSHEQRRKTGNEDLQLLSAERLDIFLQVVLTIIATGLLLAPVFTLFRLQPTTQAEFHAKSNYQILTVFIFTLVFSASCSIFTSAKRQEIFTATAAYCAVLVVFLGNTSNVMMSQNSG